MIKFDFDKHCTGCAVCVDSCPKRCIRMVKNRWDFLVPQVDVKSCVDCHKCENNCPVINVGRCIFPERKLYCAFNKDNDLRKKGSSGSVMLVFAQYVISLGGTVYGAAFNNDLEVVHTRATTLLEVFPQCKSKYIQSQTQGVYKKVKADLDIGKYVLFVGTPCQVNGLYNFLNNKEKYQKLILIDFLCHGVPNQTLFTNAILQYEKLNQCKVLSFNFRHKRKGYPHNFSMRILRNGVEENILGKSNEFPYYCGYRRYYAFRESCYECRFVGKDRVSDFTIGDFWGLQNNEKYKDFYEKGYSMLYVNSQKAKHLLSLVNDNIELEEYPIDDVVSRNHSYLCPTHKSIIHKWFMKDYLNMPYENLERKYFASHRSIYKKILLYVIKKIER